MSVPPTDKPLVVRAVQSSEDCLAVAQITAQAFPEEVKSQGVTQRVFVDLEHEDLLRNPHYWPTIGEL